MAKTITTREEWEAAPYRSQAVVQYTGDKDAGPTEIVFVKNLGETNIHFGWIRAVGGAHWREVWDHQVGAALLTREEEEAKRQDYGVDKLKQAMKDYSEITRMEIEEARLRTQPFGRLRMMLQRLSN